MKERSMDASRDWKDNPIEPMAAHIVIEHDERGIKYRAHDGLRDYRLPYRKDIDPKTGEVVYDSRCAPPPPGYEVRYFLREYPVVVPIGWQDAKMRAVETERTRDEAERRFKEAERAWREAINNLNDLERTETANPFGEL
jgi:hypothetical protein